MDTIEQFKHLFRFNEWANGVVLGSTQESGSSKCLGYLAHILITEKEYFERLYGKDSTGFDFWPGLSIGECETLISENTKRFENLLSECGETGLARTASYKTSEGVPYVNSFRDILTHVLFHSMNHRGQILTILRNEGFEPPAVDYIVFERNL